MGISGERGPQRLAALRTDRSSGEGSRHGICQSSSRPAPPAIRAPLSWVPDTHKHAHGGGTPHANKHPPTRPPLCLLVLSSTFLRKAFPKITQREKWHRHLCKFHKRGLRPIKRPLVQ
ncbi:hypothetical protein MRX96_020913 [Rhipicephalus microplus]